MPYVYVKKMKKSLQPDGRARWHEEVKNKALALRSQGLTYKSIAAELGVPFDTISNWKETDWWKDGLRDIRNEDYTRLDKKLTDMLESTMLELQDRIKNGDSVYDPRTGKIKRVPVKMRDLNTAMNAAIEKRQLIRNLPSKIVENVSHTAQLANLAQEFAKFVSARNAEPLAHRTFDLIENETVIQGENGEWVMAIDANNE